MVILPALRLLGCSPCARFLFLPTSLTTVFEVVLTPFFILRHVINPVGSTLETHSQNLTTSYHSHDYHLVRAITASHLLIWSLLLGMLKQTHRLLSQKTRGKTRLRGKVLSPAVNVERVLSSSAVSLWWYQVGWRKPTSGLKRKGVC